MKMKCADLIFQKCAETRALASVACTFCQPHLLKCSERLSFLRLLCEIELPLQSRAHFADPIFQKCPERFNVLRFLCETDLLLPVQYTLVHIFPPPSSKSAPNASTFYDFYVKSSSHYSLAHIFPTPLPKVLQMPANRALATVLCAFCRQLLQIEARTRGNRDPTSANGSHFTLKNKGFRARECFQA